MNSDQRQSELAREFILFIEQENESVIEELRSLDNDLSPSLTKILTAFDELPHSSKITFTILASENEFAQNAISIAIKHGVLKPESSAYNGYRNGLITFSFLVGKYFELTKLTELTNNIWANVARALIGDMKVWRSDVSLRTVNAARNLKNTFNKTTTGNHLKLSAYSNESNSRGRSPNETNLDHICSSSKNYLAWLSLWNEWKKDIVLKNAKKLSAALSHFINFLKSEKVDLDPKEFLLLKHKPCFWKYIKEINNDPRPIAIKVHEFSNWIINDKLRDAEGGNYALLATPLLEQQVYAHVLKYKRRDFKGKAENVKAVLPIKYLNLLKTILTEDDASWPKSLAWTWQPLLNHKTNVIENVWLPHLTIIYLLLLELPVRKIQVAALDSGEGDDFRWIDGNWQFNNTCTRGYWSMNHGDTRGRGVIRRPYIESENTTSIYINTNKTQDIEQGFGATSGYTIEWHNQQIIALVDLMRDWQALYNPIDKPTAYRDLPKNTFADDPTEAVINMIPDRFYLFRYPLNAADNGSIAPPADYVLFKFWHVLMNELEQRLKELGEDVTITTGWNGSLPNKSIFTPHCLRGSGLTALSEAGVPFEILSKIIAGHSAYLMTLGYVKYNSAYISNALNEARIKIEKSEQENYTKYLKNSTWDDAYKYAIFNESLDSSRWEATKSIPLFENRQIGVCPNSGTRCNEGGESLRRDGSSTVNAPVPGGNGNCVRCRFFMTGLPFLIPLWLKCNKDLSEAQQLSTEANTISIQLEQLRAKRYKVVKEEGSLHVPSSMQVEIKQTEARLDAKSAKLDEVLLNAHAAYNLVEKIKERMAVGKATLPQLGNETHDIIGENEFHDVSLFKQRDFLIRASRLYPHIKDERLELERNHFIDQIMFNMGMTPITLSTLTPAEKESACDAAAKFLNARLSDHELSMLESGAININDLGIDARDVQALSTAIGNIKNKLN